MRFAFFFALFMSVFVGLTSINHHVDTDSYVSVDSGDVATTLESGDVVSTETEAIKPKSLNLPSRSETIGTLYVPNGFRLYAHDDVNSWAYGYKMVHHAGLSGLLWHYLMFKNTGQLDSNKGGIMSALVSTALLPVLCTMWVASLPFVYMETRARVKHALSDNLSWATDVKENPAQFELNDLGEMLGHVNSQPKPINWLKWVRAAALVALLTTGDYECLLGMAIGSDNPMPQQFEGDDLQKAKRKRTRLLRSIERLKRKVHLASGYKMFPTLVVSGEAHGSQSSPTLDGNHNVRKPKAPKCELTASGRWNAAVVKMLSEINIRRAAGNMKEWTVMPTDILFTEFRNGANTTEVVKALRNLGYAPMGPGVFVKLKDGEGKTIEYNKYLMEVCETAKDIRSYGRSYTTSPVLDFINSKVPVHFVSMKAMGIDSDGPSFYTQQMDGNNNHLAFQGRFITAPEDLRSHGLLNGLCKGLFVGGKIVKNVSTGEAQWVTDRDLWDSLRDKGLLDKDCPVIEHEGTQYQAGFFMDTSNMSKGNLKKSAKGLANDKVVTTIEGNNFVSFVIAEQFQGRTSLGWQTIQLLHTSILNKHKDALKGKLDARLSKMLDDDFDPACKDHLTRSLGKLRALPNRALQAINLMKSLSGKQMGRIVFGAGLSGSSDYVLELADMPAGWAIHNPPRSANHDDHSNKTSWSADSRYPQQGFESLIAMRNISATQLAYIYEWVVEGHRSEDRKYLLAGDTGAFINALHKQCGEDEERVKLVLTGIKAILPFVKLGCKIMSHKDQFGRLRGDSDGDKNFWSYDKTIVAIVKEVEKVAAKLPLPRLEVSGDGIQIHPAFDNGSYYSLAEAGVNGKRLKDFIKVANLLCANNNGQGPVGLIANLSTVPLSRLEWSVEEVDGEPRIVWGNPKSEKWFAYLLLMQQCAIDMQKRIYPPPSLLNWEAAELFASEGDDAEALTAPKDAQDKSGHYRMLSQDEAVWTMSPKMAMEISCFEDGLMYNERCLSHWAAWVLNGILFNYDFLNGKTQVNGEAVRTMKVASKKLAEEGIEEFYEFIAQVTGCSVNLVNENWVLTEDLLTWKKGANLSEVVGVPSQGIKFIWQLAIDTFKSVKEKAGFEGKTPFDILAGFWSEDVRKEAYEGSTGSYSYLNNKGNKKVSSITIKIDPAAWQGLFYIFAELTSANRKDIAESEFMQGDTPKDPSGMKQMLREIFDHSRIESDGLTRHMSATVDGKAIPMGQLLGRVFSNESSYNHVKRKLIAQIFFRAMYCSMVELCYMGGAASTKQSIQRIEKLVELGILTDAGFSKACPEGTEADKWQSTLDKHEKLINKLEGVWVSDENRTFRSAVSRWNLPTFVNKGDLGLYVEGRGYPLGKPNNQAALRFVKLVEEAYINNKALQTAEWIADSVWPVFGLVWDLTEETVERAQLLSNPVDLGGDLASIGDLPNMTQERVQSIVGKSIEPGVMLRELILDKYAGQENAFTRSHLFGLIESVDFNELCLLNDDALQKCLSEFCSNRFQRKVLARLRPITGARRALEWYNDWFTILGREEAQRRPWVSMMVRKSLFTETYLKDETGQPVVDGEGRMILSSRWFKSAVKFELPALHVGDFFHNILKSDFSASGMYILCEEKRANGRFSVSRWCFFDGLTYRLSIKNLHKGSWKKDKGLKKYGLKAANTLMKNWLMAHFDGASEICIGHAYHRAHYNTVQKWAGEPEVEYQVPFSLTKFKGYHFSHVMFAVDRFLKAHHFEYQPKASKEWHQIEVKLPYTFGCNNKLSSLAEKARWFMSSKLWTVLTSLGLVDFDTMQFEAAAEIWRSTWGFAYPTAFKKDRGQSDLGHGNANSSKVRVKQPLPWFTSSDPLFRHAYTLSVGKGFAGKPERLHTQGLPGPRQAIDKAIELYYDNPHTKDAIKSRRQSTHKAILGCLGLSSIEYQFECLMKDSKADHDMVKAVSRGWASISVSGLRDLFGGLGEMSGWTVGQTYYVGSRRTMAKETLLLILEELWQEEPNIEVGLEDAHVAYAGWVDGEYEESSSILEEED